MKIPVEGGGARYALTGGNVPDRGIGEIGRALRSFSAAYEPIGNFLVVRTTPGNAPAFCVVLDRQRWPEIAGTIAGDDTILVIARTATDIGAASIDSMHRQKRSIHDTRGIYGGSGYTGQRLAYYLARHAGVETRSSPHVRKRGSG